MKIFTSFFVVIAATLILSNAAFGQITLVGPATSAASTTPTLTIPRIGTLAIGDVMIATITQGDTGPTGSLSNATRTGWGLVSGGELGASIFGFNWWGTVLFKVADATDVAAANFAFTLDADVTGSVGYIIAYRGVSTTGVGPTGTGTGPFDVAASTFVTGFGTTATLPGITTINNGAAVIMLAMTGNDNTFTPTSGLVEVRDTSSVNGPDEAVFAAWATQVVAGATGAQAASIDGTPLGLGAFYGAVLIALRPAGPLSVNAGPDQTITLPTNSVTLSGSSAPAGTTYQWTIISPVPATAVITNPTSASTTVTNLSQGVYTFRLTVNGTNADDVVVTVNAGVAPSNLYASQAITGGPTDLPVVGFATAPGSGAVINGPTTVFDPYPASTTVTAALGLDANGVFYYLNNLNPNTGTVTLNAYNPATVTYNVIATADINGATATSLGFVRLAISPTGVGWILAGDGATILHLASFPANGTAATAITVVNPNVGLVGGTATPATFTNGDLAFDGDGTMFALGNNGSGFTTIYTMSDFTAAGTLNFRLNLLDNSGNPFAGAVNGVAFDATGNAFVSTNAQGLFFIDASTVDNVTGTVNCQIRWIGTGLTDLATNFFPGSSLPVKLTSFTVAKQGSDAIAKWTTEQEINNDHFEIERSSDGTQFTKVGTVAGNGTTSSSNNYQFTDPLAGVTSKIVYYRLRDVDIAGKGTYSKIVAVRLDGSRGIKNFTVYPNPFTSNIKVNISSEGETNVTLNISNMTGQQVRTQKVKLQNGDNVVVIDKLNSLQQGVYTLELITPETRMIQKLVRH